MSADIKRRVVVTGASSGIGREIAIMLAQPGVCLWIFGRGPERLKATGDLAREKGAEVQTVILDFSHIDELTEILNVNFPEDLPIDSVYLAAGMTSFGEFQYLKSEDLELLYKVNLLSPIQMCHHFYRHMIARKSGEIVLVSSLSAFTGYPTASFYATTKAGLLGLYKSLVYEGKCHGVSVVHVAVGYVNSSIYKNAIYRNTTYERTMKSIKKLGFAILEPREAAQKIVRGVERGKTNFATPAYATLMKWIAPRVPRLVNLVHRRMLKIHNSIL
ncbi:SDR family NAD(P)-dependent oxidoreductase [Luteolibacter algae]|uniref:SDR family NAD(P)-dependent oxidoreductase n=1 Tax=Luteolibacter algae TaxID=454151 RepID=A0ABW5D8I1_9BACT